MKAIIFDLDGVICHTDSLHYKAWKEVADQYGIYFDEKINNRLRGVSRMESLEIILERYEGDQSKLDKNGMAEAKNNIYKELLKTMSPRDVSEEVLDTLQTLKRGGIKLAIGSSSKNARFILNQIGLLDFFDAISDGNNITHSKPDPEVFLKAAEFLGEKPEECLVVEDAEAGLIAAHRAGMKAAGIGGASLSPQADFSLKSFGQLPRVRF